MIVHAFDLVKYNLIMVNNTKENKVKALRLIGAIALWSVMTWGMFLVGEAISNGLSRAWNPVVFIGWILATLVVVAEFRNATR